MRLKGSSRHVASDDSARFAIITDTHGVFGCCPRCVPTPRMVTVVNVGSAHFGICVRHRVYWLAGSNVLRWRDQGMGVFARNASLLHRYVDVSEEALAGHDASADNTLNARTRAQTEMEVAQCT